METKDDVVMSNSQMNFSGSPSEKISPECAVVGLICNEMMQLEEDYYASKSDYYDEHSKNPYSSEFCQVARKCAVIEGKMEILNELKRNFCNMFPELGMSN